MSLSTYTDLVNAIPTWMARSDISSAAGDFVDLAVTQCNRDLSIEPMNTRVTLSTSNEFVALPVDYKSVMALYVATSPITSLPYRTRNFIESITYGSYTGTPLVYTIVGTDIQLAPAPDMAYSLYLDYKANFPALSSSNETNWLTDNAMDLLLYASLTQAAKYVRDDAAVKLWTQEYQLALEEVKAQDRSRVGGYLEMVAG